MSIISYTEVEAYNLKNIDDIEELNCMVDKIMNSDISLENFIKAVQCYDTMTDIDKLSDNDRSKLVLICTKYKQSFKMFFYKNDTYYNDFVLSNNITILNRASNNIMLFYMLKDGVKVSTDVELSEQILAYYKKISNEDLEKMIEYGIIEKC